MSFNRGIKRDSFGNRSFNNRASSGGGGSRVNNMAGGGMGNNMGSGMGGGAGAGGAGGGGGGGGGSGSNSMNPWEGGMMPGRGILPTPNNNISLASPQAQLAIASNLLSNLLRSQQEVQPQVPSLLSLGNNFSGPGPNFSNQQNYSSGRFSDRPTRHAVKNQRPQPYNKMGNRARDGPAGRRGPSAQQSRAPQSGNQRMNGNQNQHRNDKSSKPIPASKQNQTAKKEQQDNKTSDNEKAEAPLVKSELEEESEEKKRDWKDEKKEAEEVREEKPREVEEKSEVDTEQETEKTTAPRTEEAPKETLITSATPTVPATPVVPTASINSKDTKDGKATGKKSEARHAESRYAEVPMSHMFCHICNKHMWDGYSFENHLRGRAHQLMLEKLDESYKLKVDLMRHELRVAEEQRELSLNNSKRRGKKVPVDLSVREYCTMCDLNFYGTLSTHRKSEKHQQLKTFLHPRCFPCVKEFPSRIEYDEHCLTPAHMKNAVLCEEQRKNKKKEKLAKGEAEVRTAEDEDKDIGTDQKNEKEEEQGEQDYVIDITENLKEKKTKIPSYKYCRQNQLSIGKSLIKEVQGFYCEKCRRFMLLQEDMNAHLRSITHYRSFVQEVKAITINSASTESKETEETEVNEKIISENNDEYEENWKRRKITHPEDKTNEEIKENQENHNNNDTSTPKKADGDEKYDPLEADAESEEEETNVSTNPEQTSMEITSSEQEQKTSVEKMWSDVDNENENDNDIETNNLIDDSDEKEHVEHEKHLSINIDMPHPPQQNTNKSPRGRGYTRGRGGPRARRSRR